MRRLTIACPRHALANTVAPGAQHPRAPCPFHLPALSSAVFAKFSAAATAHGPRALSVGRVRTAEIRKLGQACMRPAELASEARKTCNSSGTGIGSRLWRVQPRAGCAKCCRPRSGGNRIGRKLKRIFLFFFFSPSRSRPWKRAGAGRTGARLQPCRIDRPGSSSGQTVWIPRFTNARMAPWAWRPERKAGYERQALARLNARRRSPPRCGPARPDSVRGGW